MRLFEAIIEANHRALAGDQEAGLHPSEFADELPLTALTCIDPRLNSLLPQVLGLPPEKFVWLRNAGNVVGGPSCSTIRSFSLACAINGCKEIVIIGHTDCLAGKTPAIQLIDRLAALGIQRHVLPENLVEFAKMFASERQNVIKGADIVRQSPLISSKIPVHGLLVDTDTGKLEWLVNGYQSLETMGARWNEVVKSAGQTVDALKSLSDFNIGEMKFPDTKIGELATKGEDWVSEKVHKLETPLPETGAVEPPAAGHGTPPKIPLPPPVRPRMHLRKPTQ